MAARASDPEGFDPRESRAKSGSSLSLSTRWGDLKIGGRQATLIVAALLLALVGFYAIWAWHDRSNVDVNGSDMKGKLAERLKHSKGEHDDILEGLRALVYIGVAPEAEKLKLYRRLNVPKMFREMERRDEREP